MSRLHAMAVFAAKSHEGAAPEPKTIDGKTGELVTTEDAPAQRIAAGSTTKLGQRSFRVKKQLTFPLLKQVDGGEIYVEITSPITESKPLVTKDGKPASDMDPAYICNVVDLNDGLAKQIIVNTVLQGTLEDTYGKGGTDPETGEVTEPGYIGVKLAIRMDPAPKGKRYKLFSIFELEEDE